MTTAKFEATPTQNEGIDLKEISAENVKEAWKNYEAKPEFKEFNKHDMIESMQSNVSRKFVFIYKLTHVSCIPIQNETYHFSIWKCSILVTFFFLLLYTFGTR
jgi:hypothetical protein